MLARWLSSRREELNARFEQARRKTPSMSAERTMSTLGTVLPLLAQDAPDDDAMNRLLQSVYDLVLLHSARDAFSRTPALLRLLTETFPRERALLCQQPDTLPAALSNVVEKMGEPMVDALADIKPASAEQLLDAGALIAWRLGEARLRESALGLSHLPARLTLDALGLREWPEAAASLAWAALKSDAWQHPKTRVRAETLKTLTEKNAASIADSLMNTPVPAQTQWRELGRLGDFTGFGGQFDEPPVLVRANGRHEFKVRSGARAFELWGDCFGWRAAPTLLDKSAAETTELRLENAVVTTSAASFRVRVLAPWREPI